MKALELVKKVLFLDTKFVGDITHEDVSDAAHAAPILAKMVKKAVAGCSLQTREGLLKDLDAIAAEYKE